MRTDLVEGTITFRSRTPRTYLLDYDAAYGSAPIAPGRIRVDVREPARPARDPVAMPDQVTLFGQASTMVDVLANDVDPAGGMLVVQRAEPRTANQVDVAVVQGRWVRVSARQGTLTPNPQIIRYTVSNGLGSGVEGEITVSQRDPVDDNTPVTQVDRVTVRAGTGITVPVLDNDFSPSGDLLRLVSHVPGEASGQLRVTATRRHPRPAATSAPRSSPAAWCATSRRRPSTTSPTSRSATWPPTRPARRPRAASRSPSSPRSGATRRPSPHRSRVGPSRATPSSCGCPGWASTPTATR